ncbi:hypothetical protein Clacol_002611 [Clathrus columnatus]|uniref:Uncharacterized protein n=1 Tax=Clathrus columnatus TaxID=1419009 RepID=A0AAV5A5W7_9AGAM|nr:hypothetical protein Clacol_002611 [Clathrus columnatus]
MPEIFETIKTPGTVNDLLAGSVAGAAQVIVGQPLDTIKTRAQTASRMASPLLGIAAVNSLLFTAYSMSRRIVSPFPELTLPQTATAGAMAGAINSVLASPVELFKVKMQGQYGGIEDKRLSRVAVDVYKSYGFRRGVMRGFWACILFETDRLLKKSSGYRDTRNSRICGCQGFEFAKRRFRNTLQADAPLPSWALLASGSFGGVGPIELLFVL